MKKIYSIFFAIFLTTTTWAQSPQKMSYQAVIRNGSDQLVTNHAVGMKISILKDATPVYVETQTPTTNTNGLVSIEIGGGTPVTGTFGAIDWSTGTYFIKTETDPNGGTSYNITGTSQLLSVPYTLYSKTSSSSIDAVKLTGDQIIDGKKTFNGTTTVITPVNDNDAANKAYVDNMLSIIQTIQTGVRDIDGNTYKVILIGNQLWMAENLKTTKYNDGIAIPNITVNTAWEALTTGAYCDYNNNPSNTASYGRLYNWFTVDNNVATKVASNGGRNVCPTGWHIPTDGEWAALTTYLGGESVAGGKLKEAGATHWQSPNTGATNETGFIALPGGYRNSLGAYYYVGSDGNWWSSTEGSATEAYGRRMLSGTSNVYRGSYNKRNGFSVRCLRY